MDLAGWAGRDPPSRLLPQLAQADRHLHPQEARQAGGGYEGLRPHPPTQEEQQEDPHEAGHGAGGSGRSVGQWWRGLPRDESMQSFSRLKSEEYFLQIQLISVAFFCIVCLQSFYTFCWLVLVQVLITVLKCKVIIAGIVLVSHTSNSACGSHWTF